MTDTLHDIEICAAILSLIERKRVETGNPDLAAEIERLVIDTQFRLVESEVLDNPGAIEP